MEIIKSTFLGILTAFFALVLEIFISLFLNENSMLFFSMSSFLAATAIAEEAAKIAFIYQNSKKIERQQIITSALFIGLGFSLTEISFNLLNNYADQSLFPAYLGILLVHCATSALAGFLMSKKEKVGWAYLACILVLNSFIHILYNLAIINLF